MEVLDPDVRGLLSAEPDPGPESVRVALPSEEVDGSGLLRTCAVGGPTDPGGGPEVSARGRDFGEAIGNAPSLLQLSLI